MEMGRGDGTGRWDVEMGHEVGCGDGTWRWDMEMENGDGT